MPVLNQKNMWFECNLLLILHDFETMNDGQITQWMRGEYMYIIRGNNLIFSAKHPFQCQPYLRSVHGIDKRNEMNDGLNSNLYDLRGHRCGHPLIHFPQFMIAICNHVLQSQYPSVFEMKQVLPVIDGPPFLNLLQFMVDHSELIGIACTTLLQPLF